MTTSIRTSADGLSSIIAVNGVDKFSVDQNGKATATKFAGDGSELVGVLKSGTAINTTSGTAHDFTGIPAGVKRITVLLNGVSTNGTSSAVIRLGTSSGIQTSTYLGGTSGGQSGGSVVIGAWSSGIELVHGAGYTNAGDSVRGTLTLNLLSSSANIWSVSGTLFRSGTANVYDQVAGVIELTDSVTTLRLTTVNGTDVFDAGKINILYE